MMEMGGYRERCWYSVGQEQRGFGWICLPLPPAHPRDSRCGLVADLRRPFSSPPLFFFFLHLTYCL